MFKTSGFGYSNDIAFDMAVAYMYQSGVIDYSTMNKIMENYYTFGKKYPKIADYYKADFSIEGESITCDLSYWGYSPRNKDL